MIDAGADLVVGHGPHVMRAMEFYKGRLVAYSLGNFAGYRALSYNGVVGIGGVLKVTLGGDGSFKSGSLTATYMVGARSAAARPEETGDPVRVQPDEAGLPDHGSEDRRRRDHHRTGGRLDPPPTDGDVKSERDRDCAGAERRARRMGRALATIHPDAHCELDFGTPLELAVATILSAQTTDVRVNQVTPKLFARYPTAADYAGGRPGRAGGA